MKYLQWENTYIDKLSGVERKKFIQEIKIIKFLYVTGSKTNSEICQHLKISAPKSYAILNELIETGIIEKQGRGISIGGRKPDLYKIKDNSLYVLGIDADRFKTRIAVFNNNNENITGIFTYPLPLDNDIETANKLFEFGSEVIEKSGINTSKLIGIGISVPGLINSRKGINYTYLHYGKKSVCDILQVKFDRPVFIENDAKAAALAEYRFGLAKGKKDVLVILLDWGIGLGLILDGRLYRGTSGFSGELSHIPMVEDGILCHCGKHGCLETIASGTSLVRLAKEDINAGKGTMLNQLVENNLDKIEAKHIVEAAKNGDQYSINILSEVGFNLGKAISILIQLYNPELIILGGTVAEARQYITTPIQQSLNTYCMRQLSEHTSIVVSEMGKDVGIMGAVAVAMEKVLEIYKK